ncbi:MAG: hypothetical protein AB8H79_24695 [Myxococcota bacterium]
MLGAWLSSSTAAAEPADPHQDIRGVTISTHRYNRAWASPAMAPTMDAIKSDGANWVSIHPYAQIQANGEVRWRPIDPKDPPAWLVHPIQQAHARGLKILIKPHLAYWGSPFSWRGEIRFDDPAARARFFESYSRWISQVAAVTRAADAFVVGTELDGTIQHEAEWRRVIATVRAAHPGQLTYAANWDQYRRVPFWDAVDAVGIQAYFPVLKAGEPVTPQTLDAGWVRIAGELKAFSISTGKPIVFTELGYDAAPFAAVEPWRSGRGSPETQRLATAAALRVLQREPHIRGAFLWKWFPGELQAGDFRLSDPQMRAVLRAAWK